MSRKGPVSLCRRRFLTGAGGFTLALPFLPSLDTRAFAADAAVPRLPMLYWLSTEHGGALESNMFPKTSLLTSNQQLYADHQVRWGALKTETIGGKPGLSPILSGAKLSAALLAKMNVLWGLDVPFYLAHNSGMHLGNFAANDGNGNDGKAIQGDRRPTIDQLMAWSPSFYPSLAGNKERSLLMGPKNISYGYSNPAAGTGTVGPVARTQSARALFDKVFVNTTPAPTPDPTPQPPPRAPIIDGVLENYKRLRNGNRRLSAADKQRLDDHIGRLDELDRKLGGNEPAPGGGGPVVNQPTQSCGTLPKMTDDTNNHTGSNATEYAKYGQLFNDVVVAAFACGTSRIATLGLVNQEKTVSYSGSWHQDIAHKWSDAGAQNNLRTAYQLVFEQVFLDLASKLNGVDVGGGRTLLDDALMSWSQECGQETHMQVSVPVVTFGSAAGYFKTGLLADFRRFGNAGSRVTPGGGDTQYLGVTYNQWLATVAQSMGLKRNEFEKWGHTGYGIPLVSTEGWTPGALRTHYGNTSSRYFADASVPLPIIKA